MGSAVDLGEGRTEPAWVAETLLCDNLEGLDGEGGGRGVQEGGNVYIPMADSC